MSRYDGEHWTTYTSASGLAQDNVGVIHEDRAGNLWCGTWFSGVSRYDGSSWKTYTTADGLADNHVTAICEDRLGHLWCGTGNGASRYDGSSWTTYTTADGLADNHLWAILEDRAGSLWFGTSGGVSRYDGSSWTTYTTADGLADNRALAILEDRWEDLWVATSDGVSRYDGSSWTTYTTADGLADNHAWAILEDRTGSIWFGTDGGASRYDGSRWTTYTKADGLVFDAVAAIVEDRMGNLWFGTWYSGVSRYDNSSWRTHTIADGLADNHVRTIVEDRASNLWFGTENGVSRYDGSRWTTYTTADNLADSVVFAILEDSVGSLWFGTNGGVSRFNDLGWVTYTAADGLASDHVRAIFEDRQGDLWFGTADSGISRFNGSDWTTYKSTHGPKHNSVGAIAGDRAGVLWFGTDDGVLRYDGSYWTDYHEADGQTIGRVRAITEDRNGDLWFGTDDGVFRYDGLRWVTYTVADGLAFNTVLAIVEDYAGSLWFGTPLGASRYDDPSWTSYTGADGLAEDTVVAVVGRRGGELWFGFGYSGGGVTEYRPDRVAPRTVILAKPRPVTGARLVSITFTAAFGELPVLFSHCLDDDECSDERSWSQWSLANVVFWPSLPDGRHVFKVRARDRHGNIEQNPAVVRFEVDATAPAGLISNPASGKAVSGVVEVRGAASDERFQSYTVRCRRDGMSSWEPPDAVELATSGSPVVAGLLAQWDTSRFDDGRYELQLAIADTLGLIGSALTEVIVDNSPPWADQTSPATVRSDEGGTVYSEDALAELYFPPKGFKGEARVFVFPAAPDTLEPPPSGTLRVLRGYSVDWDADEGPSLQKTGIMTLHLPAMAPETADSMALYLRTGTDDWRRLGGTLAPNRQAIASPFEFRGTYALCVEGSRPIAGRELSDVRMTPRVFSLRGSHAPPEVAISFSLGQSGPVTVRIFNRAGRLVREVAQGQAMIPGQNVVRWDGRDESGVPVLEGLYLVAVEGSGQRRTAALVVVR